MKFTRGFQVVKGETKYINTTQSSDFIIDLAKITDYSQGTAPSIA